MNPIPVDTRRGRISGRRLFAGLAAVLSTVISLEARAEPEPREPVYEPDWVGVEAPLGDETTTLAVSALAVLDGDTEKMHGAPVVALPAVELELDALRTTLFVAPEVELPDGPAHLVPEASEVVLPLGASVTLGPVDVGAELHGAMDAEQVSWGWAATVEAAVQSDLRLAGALEKTPAESLAEGELLARAGLSWRVLPALVATAVAGLGTFPGEQVATHRLAVLGVGLEL